MVYDAVTKVKHQQNINIVQISLHSTKSMTYPAHIDIRRVETPHNRTGRRTSTRRPPTNTSDAQRMRDSAGNARRCRSGAWTGRHNGSPVPYRYDRSGRPRKSAPPSADRILSELCCSRRLARRQAEESATDTETGVERLYTNHIGYFQRSISTLSTNENHLRISRQWSQFLFPMSTWCDKVTDNQSNRFIGRKREQ
jgi:hypothetical protein